MDSNYGTHYTYSMHNLWKEVICYVLFLGKEEPKKFTIVFDTNGGKSIENIVVEENEKVKLPTNVEKEGYTFNGWKDENGKIVSNEYEVKKDVALSAQWISNNAEIIIISFDTDGGTEIADIVLEKGKELNLPKDPTKEGYIFKGWIDKNETPIYDKILLAEDTELKVVWEKREEEKVEDKKEYYCDKGYTLKDDKCIKTETKEAKEMQEKTCPEDFELTGEDCTKTEITPAHIANCGGGEITTDAKGNYYCSTYDTIRAFTEYTCPKGYKKTAENTCESSSGPTIDATQEYYCLPYYELNGQYCTKKITMKLEPLYTCGGLSISDTDTCTKTITKEVTYKTIYSCEDGYKLDGTKCIKTTIKNAKIK